MSTAPLTDEPIPRPTTQETAARLLTLAAGVGLLAVVVLLPDWSSGPLCRRVVGGDYDCSLPLISWVATWLLLPVGFASLAIGAALITENKPTTLWARAGWVLPVIAVALTVVVVISVIGDPLLGPRLARLQSQQIVDVASDAALVVAIALSWWSARGAS